MQSSQSLVSFRPLLGMYSPQFDAEGDPFLVFEKRKVGLNTLADRFISVSKKILFDSPLELSTRKLALEIIAKLSFFYEKVEERSRSSFFYYYFSRVFRQEDGPDFYLPKLQKIAHDFCQYTSLQIHKDFGFNPDVKAFSDFCQDVQVTADGDDPVWFVKEQWLLERTGTESSPLEGFESVPMISTARHLTCDGWKAPQVFFLGAFVDLHTLTWDCIRALKEVIPLQVVNDQGEVKEDANPKELKLARRIIFSLQCLYGAVHAQESLTMSLYRKVSVFSSDPEEELAKLARCFGV